MREGSWERRFGERGIRGGSRGRGRERGVEERTGLWVDERREGGEGDKRESVSLEVGLDEREAAEESS